MNGIMQYGIPIVMAIGIILLAIVAIKLISFAIQYLSLGIDLYKHARSKYVSQELREKAHPVIIDTIIIAAAYFGIAICAMIFIWAMVTGVPYLVFVINICTIIMLVTFVSIRTNKTQENNMSLRISVLAEELISISKSLQQLQHETSEGTGARHRDESADTDGDCQDSSTNVSVTY